MKCSDICQNLKDSYKPGLFQGYSGMPAGIDYSSLMRVAVSRAVVGVGTFLVLKNIACLASPKIYRESIYFPAEMMFFIGAISLYSIVCQVQKTLDCMQRCNVIEFLESSNPSRELVHEIMKSNKTVNALVRKAASNPSLLQKKNIVPLIALYADRHSMDLNTFESLFIVPWTKEEKFSCLKVLLERSNINALNLAIEKELFQADDLSTSQKQELWLGHTEATKPLLERLGCSTQN